MPERRTPSGQGPGAAGRRRGASAPGRHPSRAGQHTTAQRTTAQRTAGPRTTAQPAANLRTPAEPGRSATRPASARRAASASNARRTTAPAGGNRFTGRAAALGLVLLALMLAYAYPVRLYLQQQAEIQRLELAQAAQRATIGQLAGEAAKWNDPAYVKAQARARFQMVEPGTKAYLVIPAPVPAPAAPGTTPSAPSNTWYGVLWGTLRDADDPGGR